MLFLNPGLGERAGKELMLPRFIVNPSQTSTPSEVDRSTRARSSADYVSTCVTASCIGVGPRFSCSNTRNLFYSRSPLPIP